MSYVLLYCRGGGHAGVYVLKVVNMLGYYYKLQRGGHAGILEVAGTMGY